MNADSDMKLTKKETDNLRAWKRWGLQMKLLKSIHREIEPRKQELRHALNWKIYDEEQEESRAGTGMYHYRSSAEDVAQLLER
jgi:hypothetical protein